MSKTWISDFSSLEKIIVHYLVSKDIYLVREDVSLDRKIKVWFVREVRILFLGIKSESSLYKGQHVLHVDYPMNKNN